MKRAAIRVSYERLAKLLELPEGVEIMATIQEPYDLRSGVLCLLITGESLPGIAEGCLAPYVDLETIRRGDHDRE